jgi:hypothetical protein
MTITRGFVIIVLSALAFGSTGCGIGFTLGTYAPDFYRIVFRAPPGGAIDPVQVGVGVGLVNGLMIGLAIGVVIVVVTTWWNVRTLERESLTPDR